MKILHVVPTYYPAVRYGGKSFMNFRLTLILTAALAFGVAASPAFQKAVAQALNEKTLSHESIPRERCIPAEDNSISDLTIVEYFDYRCLACKKVDRLLQQIAHEDDIFNSTSIQGLADLWRHLNLRCPARLAGKRR
jgi:hypothetical protein